MASRERKTIRKPLSARSLKMTFGLRANGVFLDSAGKAALDRLFRAFRPRNFHFFGFSGKRARWARCYDRFMCGRYNLIADAQAFIDAFEVINRLDWRPRYNIAPSGEIPTIRQVPQGRKAVLLRWGLIPYWARDEKFGYRTINVRAETVDQKPVFRSAFRRRRCLIPATSFYEWQKLNQHKQPWNIRVKDRELFAFAGLWEHWRSPEGKAIDSCTIIVTEANEALKPIHDRMPVILDPGDYDTWLGPGMQDTTRLKALLKPWPAEEMECWPVSRRVGNPANDDPSLLEPLE